jgi:hypothetical protein
MKIAALNSAKKYGDISGKLQWRYDSNLGEVEKKYIQ